MTGRRPATNGKRLTNREIKRYLRTRDHDHDFAGWLGRDWMSRITAGKQAMEDAPVAANQSWPPSAHES